MHMFYYCSLSVRIPHFPFQSIWLYVTRPVPLRSPLCSLCCSLVSTVEIDEKRLGAGMHGIFAIISSSISLSIFLCHIFSTVSFLYPSLCSLIHSFIHYYFSFVLSVLVKNFKCFLFKRMKVGRNWKQKCMECILYNIIFTRIIHFQLCGMKAYLCHTFKTILPVITAKHTHRKSLWNTYTQAHTYGLSEWKNPGNKKCTFEFMWREKQQEHPTENHQP